MRLASYIAHGRASFGAVVGGGVVDFRVRFGSRFATLVDLIRANVIDEVHAAVAGSDSARVSLSRITLSTCGNQHSVVSMAPMAPLKLMSEGNVMPLL